MRAAQRAIEALDKSVLLGLYRRDIAPNDAGFLNRLKDCHTRELSAVARHNRLWHAPLSNHPIQV
jgi:hypothetical protein